ncbi:MULTISPECIES: c-type cytochrome [unclassified Bradyrhizobium]|uniref:c-type cytochrome n=1 Tax=unclassified Bradyrhizobium TaxID=2631580 RepID=UPI0028ECC247|nr:MULTISPECIES: c-type cytochrome [unclassified Bradyrhizobium]
MKPDTGGEPKLAEIGARIFRYGSPGAPPCAACHGDGGSGGGMMGGHMGMMGGAANAPRLYGQHADYLVRQLDAFASGARRSPVMEPIASIWREQDRRAVAEYLSRLR